MLAISICYILFINFSHEILNTVVALTAELWSQSSKAIESGVEGKSSSKLFSV